MTVQVTYKPKNSIKEAHRAWDFDPSDMLQSQAEMVEKRYGGRFSDWVKSVQAGEARARRVLLWHLLRLEHHTLRMEDVPDFRMGELEVEYSISDLQKLRTQVHESSMDDKTKEETLEALDLEIATRLGKTADEVTPEDLGKAESLSGGGSVS